MAHLTVRDLRYAYPGEASPALKGVSLEAPKGQMTAIVGPNAAGKTTLALLLKGILAADGGEISIGGTIRKVPGADRRVGLVFSNPENAIISSLVEEDVAFGLEVNGLDPGTIRRRVESVIEALGIGDLRMRMPHLLSGGEQQMVALAGALAAEPDVLVLDEPTTFIDPPGRRRVMSALSRICREGGTVLLITHDMEEAAQCSRVVVLRDGAAVAQGDPERIFSDGALMERSRLRPPFPFLLREGMARAGCLPADAPHRSADILEWMKRKGSLTGPVRVSGTSPGPPVRPPIFRFREVRFGYASGRHAVLSGVDLDVPEASITLLCGANGSGKSTLLQMANGLLTPQEGRVEFRGEPVGVLGRRRGGIASRVGLLFQNPERQVFAETVFDDVAFGPRNLGFPEAEVRRTVLAAMERVDLPDSILGRQPWTLSGGQLRRLAVAGVLAMKSEMLVMDEPTDGLDPGGVEDLWNRFRELARDGVSILAATHQVPEWPGAIDRLALLSGGRLRGPGTVQEMIRGDDGALLDLAPVHILAQAELSRSGFSIPAIGLSREQAVCAIVEAFRPYVKDAD